MMVPDSDNDSGINSCLCLGQEEEEGQKNNCQSWLTKDGCYVIFAYCIQAKVFRHPIVQYHEKLAGTYQMEHLCCLIM